MYEKPSENVKGNNLLTSREIAKLLHISERTLWSFTAPRGELPAIRIGRVVRYDPHDIETFIGKAKSQDGVK